MERNRWSCIRWEGTLNETRDGDIRLSILEKRRLDRN